MNRNYTDFTTKFGPSGSGAEWEMHSFERAAWTYWNGFANALLDAGFSEAQVKYAVASTYVRHMLDKVEGEIEDAGYNPGRQFAKEHKSTEWRESIAPDAKIEQAIDKIVAEDLFVEITNDEEAQSALDSCVGDLQRVSSLSRSDKLAYLRNVRTSINELIDYWQ